jgi:hypothetical protein
MQSYWRSALWFRQQQPYCGAAEINCELDNCAFCHVHQQNRVAELLACYAQELVLSLTPSFRGRRLLGCLAVCGGNFWQIPEHGSEVGFQKHLD